MFVSTDGKVHAGVQGSSLSLLNSKRAAFAVVLMGSVLLMTIFRDFRRDTTPRCPLSGCLSSVVCRVRSVRIATARLMSDGAIPASSDRLLVFVGLERYQREGMMKCTIVLHGGIIILCRPHIIVGKRCSRRQGEDS